MREKRAVTYGTLEEFLESKQVKFKEFIVGRLHYTFAAYISAECFSESRDFKVIVDEASHRLVLQVEDFFAAKKRESTEEADYFPAAPKNWRQALQMALELLGVRKYKGWLHHKVVKRITHYSICPHTGIEFKPYQSNYHIQFLEHGWMEPRQVKVLESELRELHQDKRRLGLVLEKFGYSREELDWELKVAAKPGKLDSYEHE